MKLVAAAKVRVEVLYNINEQLQVEDVDAPLTKVRPVKKVALVVITGDRGLCGGYNSQIIRKAELRFEQDPVQILDALLPLYLNSQILKALQESLASELANRMSAMSSASDNASDLKKSLSKVYNRQRQAKITGEILEIVAGADALS
ncbi:ATP synthase gamma chain, chloroplastic [Linum grandiflorum]